jgi:DNA-binding NarL/FixJ family response regulator
MAPSHVVDAPPIGFAQSERRIVRLAQRGLMNAEIAKQQKVSLRTVENHLSRAYAKLGVRSRTELALLSSL